MSHFHAGFADLVKKGCKGSSGEFFLHFSPAFLRGEVREIRGLKRLRKKLLEKKKKFPQRPKPR
jgi:hypothetical protein